MKDIIAKGGVEPAPETRSTGEVCYIPHFGVRHPTKPEKLRVVL